MLKARDVHGHECTPVGVILTLVLQACQALEESVVAAASG